MPLSSKMRARLRADAHHLSPIVQVGKEGLTQAMVASLEDALRTRELVKIHVARSEEHSTRELADVMARKVGAEVVQVIGRTVSLWREKRDEG